jgi:hypothetical protein
VSRVIISSKEIEKKKDKGENKKQCRSVFSFLLPLPLLRLKNQSPPELPLTPTTSSVSRSPSPSSTAFPHHPSLTPLTAFNLPSPPQFHSTDVGLHFIDDCYLFFLSLSQPNCFLKVFDCVHHKLKLQTCFSF